VSFAEPDRLDDAVDHPCRRHANRTEAVAAGHPAHEHARGNVPNCVDGEQSAAPARAIVAPSPPASVPVARRTPEGHPLNAHTHLSAAIAPAAAWARATRWRKPLLAFAAPFLLLVVLQVIKFSPLGTDWLILVDFLLFALVALAVLAIAWGLLSTMVPSRRARVAPRLVLLSLFVAGALAGMQAGKPIREHGWRNVAERGDAVVVAIHAFEARNGRPPANLSELVPAFLARAPRTGLGSRPEFRYAVRHGDAGRETWSLWARVPGLGHATDFVYLPEGEAEAWDTILHRVGAWAVVAND
jgi:hypothetical protein